MRGKRLIFTVLATPLALVILIVSERVYHGPSDTEKFLKYTIQKRNIDSEWDKFPFTPLRDEAFPGEVQSLVTNAAIRFPLETAQTAGLRKEIEDLFLAYSSGSYASYRAFRLPPDVPFHWVSNRLGTLQSALEKGNTIALPKALERWFVQQKAHINWATRPAGEQFLAYLRLYGGKTLFTNYFAGLCGAESRILLSRYTNRIPDPWQVKFTQGVPYPTSYAAAPVQFLNMGYFSQKAYTFAAFDQSLEETKERCGTVIVADCFLFVKRSDADRNMPLIARFYWEPKSIRWLPADIVVCNMEEKGEFWPLF